MKALGAPAEIVEEIRAKSAKPHFEVLEENWETVQMFLNLQTQWVVSGMGGPIGLNYQSVKYVFELHEIENPREMLEDIQTIEFAVLSVYREKAEKEVKA